MLDLVRVDGIIPGALDGIITANLTGIIAGAAPLRRRFAWGAMFGPILAF